MQMFEERLKFKVALYILGEICDSHPTCATCCCVDYCDLLEKHGLHIAIRQIKEKENRG